MTNCIGSYLRQQRLDQNLTLRDLAQQLGYKNLQKGMNRIKALEERGRLSRDLLPRIIQALQLDPDKIEALRQRQRDIAGEPEPGERHELYRVGRFLIDAHFFVRGVGAPPATVQISGDELLVSVGGRNALARSFIIAEALSRVYMPD